MSASDTPRSRCSDKLDPEIVSAVPDDTSATVERPWVIGFLACLLGTQGGIERIHNYVSTLDGLSVVSGNEPDSAEEKIDPGALERLVRVGRNVRAVDDPPDLADCGVVDPVNVAHDFERAEIAVVPPFHP